MTANQQLGILEAGSEEQKDWVVRISLLNC